MQSFLLPHGLLFFQIYASMFKLNPTLLLVAATSRLHLASARCKERRCKGGILQASWRVVLLSLLSFFGLANIAIVSQTSGGTKQRFNGKRFLWKSWSFYIQFTVIGIIYSCWNGFFFMIKYGFCWCVKRGRSKSRVVVLDDTIAWTCSFCCKNYRGKWWERL